MTVKFLLKLYILLLLCLKTMTFNIYDVIRKIREIDSQTDDDLVSNGCSEQTISKYSQERNDLLLALANPENKFMRYKFNEKTVLNHIILVIRKVDGQMPRYWFTSVDKLDTSHSKNPFEYFSDGVFNISTAADGLTLRKKEIENLYKDGYFLFTAADGKEQDEHFVFTRAMFTAFVAHPVPSTKI
jgi:hypothetical protein